MLSRNSFPAFTFSRASSFTLAIPMMKCTIRTRIPTTISIFERILVHVRCEVLYLCYNVFQMRCISVHEAHLSWLHKHTHTHTNKSTCVCMCVCVAKAILLRTGDHAPAFQPYVGGDVYPPSWDAMLGLPGPNMPLYCPAEPSWNSLVWRWSVETQTQRR